MDWLVEHWSDVVNIAFAIIGVAAMITALTPTPKDDGWVKKARKILDVVAQNYAHAKNASDDKAETPTDKVVE